MKQIIFCAREQIDEIIMFRPGKSRSEKNAKIFKRGNEFDGDPAKDSEGKLGRREGL